MNKLLLIMGDLACGKSTFADMIAKQLNIVVFHKDTIKEILGDTVGFQNREENLKLSKGTMEIMKHNLFQLSKLNQDVILEANFHNYEIESIKALVPNYDVLILYLKADPEVLFPRHMNRILHENRHPVHLSAPFDTLEVFKDYILNIRKEVVDGKIIDINANDFSYQTDQKLLNQIKIFFGKKND